MSKNAISPTRGENYPEWYQSVVKAADLAENAPDIRGCMIIKPWGYAIWENIQRYLDASFKATGHVNAYFPLLIPMSYIAKEADHIDGFAKECAVVTHSRLEAGPDGKLAPAGELEEPYIIRPTSETTIGHAFARWIQSYRDLPLKLNQWANVMRWEMRTRIFLRTSEFLWQEGHTAHATVEEAMQETMQMLDIYADFAQDIAAIPVIKGEKTPEERFPGAVNTYTIEAMMQDKKALQSATSHYLGTTFSNSFGIQFSDQAGVLQHAQTTSWGLTTRIIGAMVMVHSDDDGLICPPRLAPQQIIIIPVIRNDEQRTTVLTYCENVAASLRALSYHGEPLRVLLDTRDINGAEKSWEFIKKGAPIRIEIGPRDIENDAVFVARRDKPVKEKQSYARAEFVAKVTHLLDEIQSNLLARAKQFADDNRLRAENLDQFVAFFTPEDAPGFVQCFCHEDADYIDIVKPLKASARCIPMDATGEGVCIFTGKKTSRQVIFAKAY
jgi:prolyl-tRNA synthetase